MCNDKIARVGKRFHAEIENIKDEKLRNGTTKERLATDKISNLIVRHTDWQGIKESIIQANKEEMGKYAE